MELAIKMKSKLSYLPGLIAIISAILALAYFNIENLTKMSTPITPFIFFTAVSIISGIIGLFSKQSRLYSFWGLGIGIFLVIHTILMIIFTISINYKP